MGMTVFDVQRKALVDEMEAVKEFLAGGRAKDYSEYREMCGLLRGLSHALELNEKLSREVEGSDYE
jgi:hypothetical protein